MWEDRWELAVLLIRYAFISEYAGECLKQACASRQERRAHAEAAYHVTCLLYCFCCLFVACCARTNKSMSDLVVLCQDRLYCEYFRSHKTPSNMLKPLVLVLDRSVVRTLVALGVRGRSHTCRSCTHTFVHCHFAIAYALATASLL